MARFVIALGIWSLFLFPAHADEVAIKDAGNAFDVTVTVLNTSHSRGTTERMALSVAQAKLATWLKTKSLQWPKEVRAEDRSFFLNLYRRSAPEPAIFGRSELLHAKTSGSRIKFIFRVFKRGIRVQPIEWLDIFAAVVNLTKQPNKLSALTHLELADRYPKDISHKPVVARIRSEIGGGFLKFITGRDVAYSQTTRALSNIPTELIALAKMLHTHPYNIDISFILIEKLRQTSLRAVLCRITNQAQRGSKLSPAYRPISTFSHDVCGESASVFVNGVSDKQIDAMRDEIDKSSMPKRGFAYDIVASFGELPLTLEARSATNTEKECRATGLQACFQAFNKRPSVDLASQLIKMSARDGYPYIAAAFTWQVWLWNGRDDELSQVISGFYPKPKPEN